MYDIAQLRDGTRFLDACSPQTSDADCRFTIASLPEDDWRKHDPRFQEPELSEHLALVERMGAVARAHDTSVGAVAVAWALANPAVDGAIVGFRRPDQLDSIVGAANLELDVDDLATIEGQA